MERRKTRLARTSVTFGETSGAHVALWPDWLSQAYLKKQYHMCRLIYKVLTPGPERISILLGKCFPLGLVSATAYRCFRHAVKAGLFPPRREWKKKKKKARFAFCSGQTQREGSTTSARVHSAERWLGHGSVWQRDVRWRTSSDRCASRNQTTLHGPVSVKRTRIMLVHLYILTNVLGDRTQTLTNHKSFEKFGVRVVYKVRRELSDCSPSLNSHLPVKQPIGEGREAGENVVISRPDKPPPEVVLIERQPRRWANRKILSGPRAEPTNQAGRGTGAFWSRGDVWGERTWASPALLLITGGFFYREAGSHPGGGGERGSGWSCRIQGCSGDGSGQIGLGLTDLRPELRPPSETAELL